MAIWRGSFGRYLTPSATQNINGRLCLCAFKHLCFLKYGIRVTWADEVAEPWNMFLYHFFDIKGPGVLTPLHHLPRPDQTTTTLSASPRGPTGLRASGSTDNPPTEGEVNQDENSGPAPRSCGNTPESTSCCGPFWLKVHRLGLMVNTTTPLLASFFFCFVFLLATWAGLGVTQRTRDIHETGRDALFLPSSSLSDTVI